MKRFEGIILCSDVDGTLVDEENNVPKENVEAIAYFQAHGGKFTVATGRIPEAVTPVIGGIHLDLPGICHNGCSIYDFEKKAYVATTELSRSSETITREIMEKFPEIGVEIVAEDGIYIIRQNFATDRHIDFERITSKQADSFDAVSTTWLKVIFAHDPEYITKVVQTMAKSPYHEDYTLVRTHQYYYEIFHKKASKGNALKHFCKLYDIDRENLCAIGDNDNDVEMLQLAAKSGAVANASPDAKSAAGVVMTKANFEGGVAEFISKL